MGATLRERLRHPDWLAEAQLALSLAGLVVAGAVIGDVAGALAGEAVAVEVPLAVLEPGEMSLPPGTSPADGGHLDLVIDHPTARQHLFSLLGSLPGKLVVATALLLLVLALRAARRDDPFAPGVARHVRRSAIVLLAGGVVAAVAAPLASVLLTGTLNADTLAYTIAVQPVWLLPGIITFAAAEVLRRGGRMRAELAEVV